MGWVRRTCAATIGLAVLGSGATGCDDAVPSVPPDDDVDPTFSCELVDDADAICAGEDCPFSHQGRLDCNEWPFFRVRPGRREAGGAPVLLVDALFDGQALHLVEVGDARVDLLPDVNMGARMALDRDATLLTHIDFLEPNRWIFRTLGGEPETIHHDPNAQTYVVTDLVAQGEVVHALGSRGVSDLESHVVLARGGPGKPWAVENVASEPAMDAGLTLTRDGTTLVHWVTDRGVWFRVGVGTAGEDFVDAPEDALVGSASIVPGESTWDAALLRMNGELMLARRDVGNATLSIPEAEWNCGWSGDCSADCEQTLHGLASDIILFRARDGYGISFVEYTVEQVGHRNVDCGFVIDEETGDSDLVVLYFDGSDESFTEVLRLPLGTGASLPDLSARAYDDEVVVAVRAADQVLFGVLDVLAILP